MCGSLPEKKALPVRPLFLRHHQRQSRPASPDASFSNVAKSYTDMLLRPLLFHHLDWTTSDVGRCRRCYFSSQNGRNVCIQKERKEGTRDKKRSRAKEKEIEKKKNLLLLALCTLYLSICRVDPANAPTFDQSLGKEKKKRSKVQSEKRADCLFPSTKSCILGTGDLDTTSSLFLLAILNLSLPNAHRRGGRRRLRRGKNFPISIKYGGNVRVMMLMLWEV